MEHKINHNKKIIIIIIFIFSLGLFGLIISFQTELKIEGLKDSYLLTDAVTCKLINNSQKTIHYYYTGEISIKDHWNEIDYSLESFSKSVLLHDLKPHEETLINWPAWRKTRLTILENKRYRFLIYYQTETKLNAQTSIFKKFSSNAFQFEYPDHNDYPPKILGIEKVYELDHPIKIELLNTSNENIDYGVGVEKLINGKWTKVLYNIDVPYNDEKLTFWNIFKGNEKKTLKWPYKILRREGGHTNGTYRLFIEYALTEGENKLIYSPAFDIKNHQ